MAKDNEDIQIKVSVDTSDVDKSMKQVSKSADKMAKDIVKAGDKAEDSFDDLKKTIKDTTKQVSDIFKNVKTTGLKTAMKDVVKTTSEATKTIKKQFKDVLNMEGTLKFTATADVESGANQAKAGASDLAKQVMTSGAMGSQIAKQMAQGFDEGTDKIADTVNELKDVLTDVDLSTGVDKETEEIKTRIKEISESIQEDLPDGQEITFDTTDYLESLMFLREQFGGFKDELEAMVNGLSTSGDAFEKWSIKLSGCSGFYEELKGSTYELAQQLVLLTELNGNGVIDTSNFEQLQQLLPSVIKDIDRLSIKTQKIKFNEDFDVQPLKDLTQAFDETRRKADMRPIIELLEQLEQQTRDMGTPLKGLKELIAQVNDEFEHAGTPTDKAKDALSRYCHTLIEAGEKGNVLALSQDKVADSMKQMVESLSDTDNVLEQTAQASDKLESSLKKVDKQQDKVSKSTKKTENAFKSLAKSLAPYLGLAAIFGTIKKSISDALEAGEAGSMFDTVFGSSAEDMNIWISDMNKTLGLGITDTKKYTATIMQMGKAMEMTNEDAMSMAQSMAKMAGDISSFYDTDITQAQEDLRSALSGSMETMDKYGIILRENTLKEFAYEEGIAAYGAELNNAQKAMATTLFIEKALGVANDDLARTINSPANQLRILNANLKDVRTALGNCFTPILTVVLPILNQFVSALASVINKVADFIAKLFSLFGVNTGGGGIFSEVAESAEGIGTALADGLDKATGGASDVADTLKEGAQSAKEIMKELMGMDEINNLTPKDSTGGSGSGGSGGGSGDSGVGGSLGDMADDAEDASDKAKEEGEEVAEWIKILASNLLAVWNMLKAGWLSVSDYISQSIVNLKQAFFNLGSSIQEFLLGAWNNGGAELVFNFGRLGGAITGAIIDISGQCVQMVADLFSYLNPETNPYTKAFIEGLNDLLIECQNFALNIGKWFGIFVDNGGQAFLNVIGDIIMILGTTLAKTFATAIKWVTTFMNSWAGQTLIKACATTLNILAGALKLVLIAVEKLSPVWSVLLTAFIINSTYNKTITFFKKLGSTIKTVVGVIKTQMTGGLVGALGKAFTSIKTFVVSTINAFNLMKQGVVGASLAAEVGKLPALFATAITSVKAWAAAMKGATVAQTAMNVAGSITAGIMGVLTSPITLVIGAIVALIAIVDQICQYFFNWEGIISWLGEKLGWLWDKITGFFGWDGENKIDDEMDYTGDSLNSLGNTMEQVSDRFGTSCSAINESLASIGIDGNKLALQLDEAEASFNEKFSMISASAREYLQAIADGNEEALAEMAGDSDTYLAEIKSAFEDMSLEEQANWVATYGFMDGVTDGWLDYTQGSYEECLIKHAGMLESIKNNENLSYDEKLKRIDEEKEAFKTAQDEKLSKLEETIANMEKEEWQSEEDKYRALQPYYEQRNQLIDDMEQYQLGSIDTVEKAVEESAKTQGEAYDGVGDSQTEALEEVDKSLETTKGNLASFKEESDKVAKEIPKEWEGIGETISDEFEGALDGIKTNFTGILNNTQKQCTQLKSGLQKTFNEVKTGVKKSMDEVNKTIKTKFTEAVNSVKTAGNNLKTSLQSIFQNISSGLSTSFTNIKTSMTNAFKSMSTTVINTMNSCKTTMSSTLTSIQSEVKAKTTTINNTVTTNFKSLGQTFTKPFTDAKKTISDSLKTMNSDISSRLKTIVNTLSGYATRMKNTMNFKFPTPYLKMPHISVYGDWNFEKKTVPSFRVNWWSSGAIFNKRTILGNMGVGDAQNGYGNNPEAVLPLDSLWKELGEQFDRQTKVLAKQNSEITINNIVELDGEVVAKNVHKHERNMTNMGKMSWDFL